MVRDAMVEKVIKLAEKLPSGLPDGNASSKLIDEIQEFEEALQNNDNIGALTELADIIYYCCKIIHWACCKMSITIVQGFAICVAKYQLRAQSGNPKNNEKERIAVKIILERE